MEIFGRYGPLASIKIMWPRSDEEKARGRNCGFVAYMARKDGERALRNLNGKDVFGYEMKLGWGKAVIIPPHPIYIPPVLMEVSQPPPPSGLPFNAQPSSEDRDILPKSDEELEAILRRAIVKVVIPNDKNLIMLIHRMVEFVVREGPMFEAMIMNRELHNPQFRFLFENQSPAHIYYRWKVFSVLHGDAQKDWKTKEFRMFQGGSIWRPPVMHSYTAGMPDDLVLDDDILKDSSKGALSKGQRDRLEDLLRNLTPEKKRIGELMVYCIDHSEAAEEIGECITESLSNDSTLITKRISRLYLVSDILNNCGVKVNKASNYRKVFQNKLIEIIKAIKLAFDCLESRIQAEGFKVRVLRVLKSWEDTGIYTSDFMTKLHNIFLGLEEIEHIPEKEEDIDGNPLDKTSDDEDPVDGAALLKSAMSHYNSSPEDEEDIDGEEIKDDSLIDTKSLATAGFIKSKWETVDPDQIEAQAMTTSKWDLLEASQDNSQNSSLNANDQDSSVDYSDTRNMSEEKRLKLREIEVKAVQYQDELESGQRTLKSGWTVTQQVEHYRRKLLRKSEKESKKDGKGDKTPKSEKHKKDYEKSERIGEDISDDEFYKEQLGNSPSPSRSRRQSPPSSRSSRRRRDSNSPISSTSKYSPPHSTSRHRYSPSPVRIAKHGRGKSPSPKRRSRSTSRTRYYSPDSTSSNARKHRHKHKY
ncbi:hypothetical protein YQE_03263, partial [Dendroctonus ponderosae]